MRGRALLNETLHMAAGIAAVAAMFAAAAWAYPQGYATIWNIGFVTMAAVAGLSVTRFQAAWRAGRPEQEDRTSG